MKIITAAVLVFAAPLAFAASTTYSSITMSYSLADLDLDDGIEPSLTFLPGTTDSAYLYGHVWHYPTEVERDVDVVGFAPFSLELTGQNNLAVSNEFSRTGQTLQLIGRGHAEGLVDSTGAERVTSYSTYASTTGNFVLSQGTRLDLSVAYQVKAEKGPNRIIDGQMAFQNAFANVSWGGWTDDGQSSIGNGVNTIGGDKSGTASMTFSNLSGADLGGSFGVGNYLYGDGLLLKPVPEPETYALMLLGAGLVGWQVRRRRA